MRNINWCIFLIFCGNTLLLVRCNDVPQCFQFTWVPPVFNSKPDRYNCSLYKSVPCIEPLIPSENPPNVTAIWHENDNSKLCNVTSGNVCIKYTFSYNSQIVNTSLFCGKATEDKVEPITSGCYEQRVGGYVVEMCACQPRAGREPCNTSTNINYSISFLFTMLLYMLISTF